MFDWVRNLKRGEKYDLSSIMEGADPTADFAERVRWLEQLVDWLRRENQTTRAKFLLQVLERNPEWQTKTGKLIASILMEAKFVRLFSEMGVPSWMSMVHEFMSRFTRVFLPPFSDNQVKAGKDAFAQIFYEFQDSEWVRQLPKEIWDEFIAGILIWIDTPAIRQKIFSELVEASLILSMKCGAIMVREDFAKRAPELNVFADHPALSLQAELLKFKAGQSDTKTVKTYLAKMDTVSMVVKEHLERFGVSIDLVFQRERLKQYIWRMRYLVRSAETLRSPDERHTESELYSFFLELVSASARDQDFASLIKQNLALFSKKVVDFTGSTGEHYIARSKLELKHLFWGAVGGGAITAFTVVLKYLVDRKDWPLFLDFVYAALIYCGSFLIIHFLHCTLATKQPSMTAAALANKIHQRDASGKDDEEFALEIKRLIHSQAVSVLGNILAVVPVAVIIDLTWFHLSGHHFFNEHQSAHMLESLSLWRSPAILYAVMTGGLLWLGGICSGWVENAAVYHQIPELIENHKILRKFFGVNFTKSLSHSFSKNISGITSSVSLGLMLAGWPMIGRFFGLPLDVRHVTLSTGSAAVAIASLGVENLKWLDWVEVVSAITVIGALNFGISFLLALTVAIRAKEVPFKRALVVLRLVTRG